MTCCCLSESKTLDDLPDEVLARFFELLAEGQERRPLWRMPPRYLAGFFGVADITATLRELVANEKRKGSG